MKEIRMHYGRYIQEYSNCRTKDYDKDAKTNTVITEDEKPLSEKIKELAAEIKSFNNAERRTKPEAEKLNQKIHDLCREYRQDPKEFAEKIQSALNLI